MTAEGRILFTGEVVNEEGKPLPDVHIINQVNREVTVTDASGFFTMYISKYHTVNFSSVGYRTFVFSVDRAFAGDMLYKTIVLEERTYTLREVTVADQEEKIETIIEKPVLQRGPDLGTLKGREPVPVAPSLMNPISLLYQQFGSVPKQKRKLAAILYQQRVDSIAYSRLSDDRIWQMTGLYGDRLEEFKEYCDLPSEFYLYATEYEFITTIRRYFIRFQTTPVE